MSTSNLRYESSTSSLQSIRQRIIRQLNNTNQAKIVRANRMTKIFNDRSISTNTTENYSRSLQDVQTTKMIQSTIERLNSHGINAPPNLNSQLIHNKLMDTQILQKINHHDNRFNLEDISNEKTNNSIIND